MLPDSSPVLPYASDTDYTPYLVGFTATCVVITSVAISARCAARHTSGTGFGADDYFAIGGFICVVVNLIADFVIAANHGVSYQPPSPAEVEVNNKAMMSINYSYSMVLVCGKSSLLFLYRRIFGMRQTWFRVLWWCILILVLPLLFTICVTFASIMAVSGSSGPTTPLTVGGVIGVSFYCAITNLGILILPIGMVVQLKIDKVQKSGLIIIFTLGSMGSVVALLRAIRTLQLIEENWDPRYASFQQLMLLNAETVTLITCACLPLLRPVLTKITNFTVRSLSSLSKGTSILLFSSPKSSGASSPSAGTKDDEVELKKDVIHCERGYQVEYFATCESTAAPSVRSMSREEQV